MNGKYYYEPYPRQVRLTEAAREWLGTPFFVNGRTMGEAVDCHNLTYALHRSTGALPEFELPRGSGRVGDQLRVARMSKFLSTRPEFEQVEIGGQLITGDLLTFRVVSGEYHMATYLGDIDGQRHTVIMALRHTGVCLANLLDPTYSNRLLAVWRIRG